VGNDDTFFVEEGCAVGLIGEGVEKGRVLKSFVEPVKEGI
jgi:hypothetical protein